MPSVFLLRRCRPSLLKAQAALTDMDGWHVCGSGERVREAPDAIAALRPDIVVADLRLLDGHAGRLAWQLQQWPRRPPPLLLLSPSADEPKLFEALRLGASAYGDDHDSGLLAGLGRLVAGRAIMSPAIARNTLNQFGLGRSSLTLAQHSAAASAFGPSGRGPSRSEQHLLSLLAHGLLIDEIAGHWGLDAAELERRVRRIYTRLHALSPRPAAQAGGAVSMKLARAASFS